MAFASERSGPVAVLLWTVVYAAGLVGFGLVFFNEDGGGLAFLGAVAWSFAYGAMAQHFGVVVMPALGAVALFIAGVSSLAPYTMSDNAAGALTFLLVSAGYVGAAMCCATALGVAAGRSRSRGVNGDDR